jgi:transposase
VIRLAAGHPEWVLGYEDEVWFSRLAQPQVHSWTSQSPLRLQAKEPDSREPKEATPVSVEPSAIACYGLLRGDTGQMMLRFVNGRPVSGVTTQFLEWLVNTLAQEGKKALLLIWDNACWHTSREVKQWIKNHNRQVKTHGGCRLLVCHLPVKSPWLNNIEPKWAHGKRHIVEPQRKLTLLEIQQRLALYYGCDLLKLMQQ